MTAMLWQGGGLQLIRVDRSWVAPHQIAAIIPDGDDPAGSVIVLRSGEWLTDIRISPDQVVKLIGDAVGVGVRL